MVFTLHIKKEQISFRNSYSFPSTTYGVFGLYSYPAKFIPQVVFYILEQFLSKEDKVFDPFAGFGTVGFVSRVKGNDYFVWDLNPMLELIHNAVLNALESKILKRDYKTFIAKILRELKNFKGEFFPNWSNIDYWFPQEIKDFLAKVWFNAHRLEIKEKELVLLSLLKVTRFFSYSDEKIHKLYKSKKAKRKIEQLLKSDWKNLFFSKLSQELENDIIKIFEYSKLKPNKVYYEAKGGIDLLKVKSFPLADAIITSPPYLQAQEYIRSTKLELFWLGYSENFIRHLSSREIPYRKEVPDISIQSDIYEKILNKIDHSKVLKTTERYFKSLIFLLENISKNIEKYLFIFVGHSYAGDIRIPIDEIIVEHFLNKGNWKHIVTYEDTIKARKMFNTKNLINPATGKVNKRMEKEYLIVLRRI